MEKNETKRDKQLLYLYEENDCFYSFLSRCKKIFRLKLDLKYQNSFMVRINF